LPLKVTLLECTEPAIAQGLKILAIGWHKHKSRMIVDSSRTSKQPEVPEVGAEHFYGISTATITLVC
jgi:hypothetical protein